MTLKNKLGQSKNKLDTKLQYIDNKQQLVEYFLKGSKTKDSWRIGTEHEKFLFDLKNNTIYVGLLDKVVSWAKKSSYSVEFENNKFYGTPFEENEDRKSTRLNSSH